MSLRIITEQRHSALGIIDRFIRTLRDMNIPTVKSEHQSTHEKYRDFTVKRMNKLLEIYNNTTHSAFIYCDLSIAPRCALRIAFAMIALMVYLVIFMIYGEVIFYIVRFCQRKSIFVAENDFFMMSDFMFVYGPK